VRNKIFVGFLGEDEICEICFVMYFLCIYCKMCVKIGRMMINLQKNANKIKIIHKKKDKL
jgi:hypothetical protein